jgi:hypothetical protein
VVKVMDPQDAAQFEQCHNNGEAMSPESSKSKLQLPLSCDPPGPANPAKQLVWIVSGLYTPLCSLNCVVLYVLALLHLRHVR